MWLINNRENIKEKWVTLKKKSMAITIKTNQKIQSIQINDNIYIYIYIYMYVCVCVCVCVCDYTTEKYKRKICYYQKNNSKVKTFERLKNIKES